MRVRIEAQDGRILARVINLAARLGCTVQTAELAQEPDCARIEASFSGDAEQLRRLGGQLARMVSDEQARAQFLPSTA